MLCSILLATEDMTFPFPVPAIDASVVVVVPFSVVVPVLVVDSDDVELLVCVWYNVFM